MKNDEIVRRSNDYDYGSKLSANGLRKVHSQIGSQFTNSQRKHDSRENERLNTNLI